MDAPTTFPFGQLATGNSNFGTTTSLGRTPVLESTPSSDATAAAEASSAQFVVNTSDGAGLTGAATLSPPSRTDRQTEGRRNALWPWATAMAIAASRLENAPGTTSLRDASSLPSRRWDWLWYTQGRCPKPSRSETSVVEDTGSRSESEARPDGGSRDPTVMSGAYGEDGFEHPKSPARSVHCVSPTAVNIDNRRFFPYSFESESGARKVDNETRISCNGVYDDADNPSTEEPSQPGGYGEGYTTRCSPARSRGKGVGPVEYSGKSPTTPAQTGCKLTDGDRARDEQIAHDYALVLRLHVNLERERERVAGLETQLRQFQERLVRDRLDNGRERYKGTPSRGHQQEKKREKKNSPDTTSASRRGTPKHQAASDKADKRYERASSQLPRSRDTSSRTARNGLCTQPPFTRQP
ncbi:hypothetical protein PLICRDRAFT_29366 [Plicaturopsis crispa FD-325 SS-3]|nr:hypothetical protein PLICRDRAFT_29366 [Plicaturopsis crispa FD-325 SS-3]